ncbi:MAG: hypothetical protein ACOC5T_02025 [Elusimicrobiota bacterium]
MATRTKTTPKSRKKLAQNIRFRSFDQVCRSDNKKSGYVDVLGTNGIWETKERSSIRRHLPSWVNVKVSPGMVQEWLDERNSHNRKMKPQRVKRFVSDMIAKRWHLSQPIIFYNSGVLADGQNRLQAVVDSGETVYMSIMYGGDERALPVIDDIKPRSDQDIASLSGVGFISFNGTRTANYILAIRKLNKASREQKLRFYQNHTKAINKVTSWLTQHGVAVGPVLAAIVYAYYNVKDKSLIEGFCQTLQDGTRETKKDPAWVLREYLRNRIVTGRSNIQTGKDRERTYLVTKSALDHHIQGHKIDRLRPKKRYHFLLPEEQGDGMFFA